MKRRLVRGALLLEVLVAAIIFSFAVTATAATAAYHERALRVHQDRNSATFLAEQQMEEILAVGFAGLPQAVAAYPQDLDIQRSVDGQTVTSQYHCVVTLTESPDRDLRTVLVAVSYPESQGLRTVRLETDVYCSH